MSDEPPVFYEETEESRQRVAAETQRLVDAFNAGTAEVLTGTDPDGTAWTVIRMPGRERSGD